MATSTLPPATGTRPKRNPLRVIFGVLLVFLLAPPAWFVFTARRALPRVDGQLSISGLHDPVIILRDAQGIPHIRARSLDDLTFAQGYITAQDRLFQMDISRRFAAGELSEILGKDTLSLDRDQRLLQFRWVADRAIQALSPADHAHFEAYVRGVNAFIGSHRDRLPIEFRLLGYQPRPWSMQDSFLVGANLVAQLNHGVYRNELSKEAIQAKLGPNLTAELFPYRSMRDRPPTEEAKRFADEPHKVGKDEQDDTDDPPDNDMAGLTYDRKLAALLRQQGEHAQEPVAGSNDWVISGAHSATGAPLLSNDMHLDLGVPGIWYEAQLQVTDGSFDVAGVSLPGVPFIIVGHNRRIAWGVTNVEPDVEDLYIEQFNAQGEYLTPAGWVQPERRHEVIHVKDAPDEALDVVVTRHGPIITSAVPGETRQLALHWTLYEKGLAYPFAQLDAAHDWQSFRQSLSNFYGPGQNFVYADVDGHIGYQMTGWFPIRAVGDGSLPVPGNDNAHEWKGYVPYDKLPSVLDPPQGVLATANGRVTPDDFPYPISTYWDVPYRTERIYEVLESGRQFAPSDMLNLQMDVHSDFEKRVADHIVAAIDHTLSASARAEQAAEILRAWDGRMTVDSAAPILIARVRRELNHELVSAAFRSHGLDPAVLHGWTPSPLFLDHILQKQPAAWLPAGKQSFDAFIAEVVQRAVSDAAAPRDLASWRRPASDGTHIEHPLFARVPVLGAHVPHSILGPGVVLLDGGAWTVKAIGHHYGPSERITMSPGDWDSSTMNIVTGQSGQPLSPHYMDQWQAWRDGTTFAWPFTDAAVDRAKVHELVLKPQ